MIEDIVKFLGAIVLVFGVVAVVVVVGAYPTKWVFNYLFSPSALTAVFGTPSIGFWQAMGVNFVAALIRGNTETKAK